MPPPTICGKGEFMFGGTLFVLSPPMRIPIIRNEQAATRPKAVSERQADMSRAKASRTRRERSTSKAMEAMRPHSARCIRTIWNISLMSPDPQLQRIHRYLAFHT